MGALAAGAGQAEERNGTAVRSLLRTPAEEAGPTMLMQHPLGFFLREMCGHQILGISTLAKCVLELENKLSGGRNSSAASDKVVSPSPEFALVDNTHLPIQTQTQTHQSTRKW